MEIDLNTLSDKIVNWIKNYAVTNNLQSLVVGVSGGVDSGLVSTLCAKTGLPTYVVSMPISQDASQLSRARNHGIWLMNNFKNIIFIEKDLTILNEAFKSLFFDFSSPLANANSRSRLRMVSLYQIAGAKKGIVVGTGNKVEDFGVGFYTKYGDGGVDISPIADLTKTEVRNMAKAIGVPEYIVNAIPTDGLWEDNRTDENQIGASYDELEWAMNYDGSHELTHRQNEILAIYNKFNTQNKHKMLPIPTFKKHDS
jgi:NAD+ synthase